MPPHPDSPLILWRLTDGKPGHEKQSLGLAQALARLRPVEIHTIPVTGFWPSLRDWSFGQFPSGKGLPGPDLILGAGHATHLPLLAARRARGGRTVVLMRPTLPPALFDLCLIPEHDAPPTRDHVIATRGALNAVVPSEQHHASLGAILIGGQSKHYQWDSRKVVEQAYAIALDNPSLRWQLTTSRRTPADFMDCLLKNPPNNLAIFPHDTTPPGWLEAVLAEASQAWVTEDSVSMLYEALTAGCAVGLIRLPGKKSGRLALGVESLIQDDWITPYETWCQHHHLAPPAGRFDESGRCARLILERWFPGPPV